MAGKIKKPDRREYTLMLVPHDGNAVRKIHIPIKAIKYGLTAVCIFAVILVGTLAKDHSAAAMSQQERAELENLRQVNSAQKKQIEDLAKSTATLKQDMDRLNALDAEVRRMLTNEESAETSRAGSNRPAVLHTGQGGPLVKPDINQLTLVVQDLQQQAVAREQSLIALRDTLAARNAKINATPSIWPTNGDVTSRFGWRGSPWGGGSDWHPGIDIANSAGTEIVATADGEVTYSGWYSGYGKLIIINHGNGIETLYGHCSELLVGVGERVNKGQIIALMGNTGLSTGPHLHYEVRVHGSAVNPASFLQ